MSSKWPLLNMARVGGFVDSHGGDPVVIDVLEIQPVSLTNILDKFDEWLEPNSGQEIVVSPCPFDAAWFEFSTGSDLAAVLCMRDKRSDNGTDRAYSAAVFCVEANGSSKYLKPSKNVHIVPAVIARFSLDASGRITMHKFGLVQSFVDRANEIGVGQDVLELFAHYAMSIMFFSWNMAACKNVQFVETHPSTRSKKAMKDPSRVVYKELLIEGSSARPSRQGLARRDEARGTAFHRVRGHFKEYSERGLFGRAGLTGKWWWNEHRAGDKSYGKVVKSYSMEP